MRCRHRKCRYRDNTAGCCEYILIEGHSRGCKPEKCEKWRTGNAAEKSDASADAPAEEKKKKSYDDLEAMRLYIHGGTDKEIAEALGVKSTTIIGWRKRRGLICHKKVREL